MNKEAGTVQEVVLSEALQSGHPGPSYKVRPSVTYHAGDIAGLLQHLCQGGFVEREASQRGNREVACDSIAKAQPAGKQGSSGG